MTTQLNDTGLALGARVRVARVASGMKQSELAAECGVSRAAIGQWEAGLTEPSASKMFAIARATNQPLDWFAEGLDSVTVRPKRLELPTF
ncbi:helix-turn-helix domain-containing protein [Microbacterium rhizomatis]|uniref:Helix-turn-helix transcriptional regulator n=1 Tax=Microbacterium rhizomatis TaxID=1631477 RepID=A0A5J5IZQ5_9MICO|nr:helix-turn-helix transcriptional regulator [Microbacterium rhizomatis]KAA9105018.1 helix-turn-helix transcriptional regulator [Microbacterium rhizomatis]